MMSSRLTVFAIPSICAVIPRRGVSGSANRNDLPLEYSQGLPAAPDSLPARWSDGVRITAHALVYSWRRAIDQVTVAAYTYVAYCIVDAEDINSTSFPRRGWRSERSMTRPCRSIYAPPRRSSLS